MSADELLEIYDELNFPGTKAFLKELRKRGIPAKETDVRDFVKSQPEQQILAAGPSYKGSVYSADGPRISLTTPPSPSAKQRMCSLCRTSSRALFGQQP